MGRGRKGSGVEPRESSIRISFTYQGKRRRETIQKPPTPANLKYAERLVDTIKSRISSGTFVYSEFFEGREAEGDPNVVTLGAMAEIWIRTKGRLAAATLSQYRLAAEFWKKLLGAERDIRSFRHSEIAAIVGSHPWASPKLCNNYLIALRGIFAIAVSDGIIPASPLEGIENMPRQRADPDPLSQDEAERILADMAARYDPRVVCYFEFAFFSGVRPEEAIALRWDRVDWNLGTVLVDSAKTFRGTLKPLKTYESRHVELNSRSRAALARMKEFTFMKAEEIFENPVTGRPWHDERSQRDHYWHPTLRRLGIRARRPYQTRHTFATMAIMAGNKPGWISKQLGHRSPQMLFSVYAKWIEAADKGEERSRFDAAIQRGAPAEFVPNLSRVKPK